MLILASQSPRRRELLERAGIPFTVQAAAIREERLSQETPEDYVVRLATEKASAIGGDLVLGADTVVVVDGEILEKPVDAPDAARMLRLLSGRQHRVITGVCLRSGGEPLTGLAETRVSFGALTAAEIESYAASGEPLDKAGAYAIQGLASRFIQSIEGDYTNVVGLPVPTVYRMLRKVNAI